MTLGQKKKYFKETRWQKRMDKKASCAFPWQTAWGHLKAGVACKTCWAVWRAVEVQEQGELAPRWERPFSEEMRESLVVEFTQIFLEGYLNSNLFAALHFWILHGLNQVALMFLASSTAVNNIITNGKWFSQLSTDTPDCSSWTELCTVKHACCRFTVEFECEQSCLMETEFPYSSVSAHDSLFCRSPKFRWQISVRLCSTESARQLGRIS